MVDSMKTKTKYRALSCIVNRPEETEDRQSRIMDEAMAIAEAGSIDITDEQIEALMTDCGDVLH
jgi:hypothetical protein